MKEEEIKKIYSMLAQYHEEYLKAQGVSLPSLARKGQYTKDALTLIYLAKDYPNPKVISKAELTTFIRGFYPDVADVQQARHLAAQKGWYIKSGTRNDLTSQDLSSGEYQLVSLEVPYPGFTKQKREYNPSNDEWDQLKSSYGNKCACCGSTEGEPHRYWSNTKTVLQKGHMNPAKPLEPGNIIPQCSKCNQADRDHWVYDAKGRVVQIANPKVVDRCSDFVKEEIYKRLYLHFDGKDPR